MLLESGYVIESVSLESIRFYIYSLVTFCNVILLENLTVSLFSGILDC